MIALYLASAAGFYALMTLTAKEHEELEATHPQPMLQVMPGGKLFEVVDGGLRDEKAA